MRVDIANFLKAHALVPSRLSWHYYFMGLIYKEFA